MHKFFSQSRQFAPIILLFLVGIFTLNSCSNDEKDAEQQAELDEQTILDYLAANNIEATRHESGLYYVITKEGTGDQPNNYSTVEVFYKGFLINGNIFDQTTSSTGPYAGFLQDLIVGWQVGVPLLKEGGSGTFYIPSAMGYGPDGANSIPGNSVLIFDIDLITVL